MAISFTNSSAASTLTALLTAIDAGAGAALCIIYSGTAPATAEASLSGNTVLANVALADPSGSVTSKTLTFSGMPKSDSSVDATGTASFFRIVTSTDGTTIGTPVLQGTVGTSGTDMIVSSTSLVASTTFQITSLSITLT